MILREETLIAVREKAWMVSTLSTLEKNERYALPIASEAPKIPTVLTRFKNVESFIQLSLLLNVAIS